MFLKIQLFQTLKVSTGKGNSLDLGTPKARSLFAYIALNHTQTIDRRRLAFLFWPHSTETAARRNLRQYLHRLRRSLEPIDPDGRLLATEGHNIRFCPPAGWHLDVAAFEAACTPPHQDLPQAVELYAGDLLEDIYDDWVVPERERLARLYRECLLQLIDHKEASQQYAKAIAYAERYLAAEPLMENAYLRLMRLHYAVGDRGRVKQSYQQLTTTLQQELDAEPLPETTAAYQAMLAGEYGGPEQTLSLSVSDQSTAGSSPSGSRPAPPFVGRESELKWLDEALQAATTARGGFYFIQGESGVGKTRLVSEWLMRLTRPVYLFNGRGHEFESMIPYNPLAQALRQAAETTIPWERFRPPPPWLASLLPLLPTLPTYFSNQDVIDKGPGRKHHIVESLGNLIMALARHRPVILYLDNLHWADAPTWNFLGYLARRAVQTQLVLIGVARAEDMPHERTSLVRNLQRRQFIQTLTLTRLSQTETNVLVRQLMNDRQLDPLFLRRIYEETEGNPFFIIETIRAVREAGGDWTQSVPTDEMGRRPEFTIPLQVQAVIESRLDKLSEESRAALGVAAAIGREFTFELLQAVSQFSTEALLNALDEWLDRGLVREIRDGYDFTHEKLSQVAYQQLSRARRQWIHHQIANTLAARHSESDPAQMAHHYYLSSHPEKALPYLAQAGQRALSVRSYAEAREFGLRAIGLLGRFPNPTTTEKAERVDLNLQLAQAYAFTGALPKALRILQETEHMAETLGDIERLARIFHRSAQIFWLRGRPDTANDYIRRTLRHAEELDHVQLRFAALRMLGRVGVVLGHFDDAIAYLLRYLDLAEQDLPPADLPVIYGYLGVAYSRVGSWQRAIESAQKGLDLANTELTGAMQAVARMQLAFVYAELQEWKQALTIADPIREVWRQEGMSPYAFMLRVVVGRCLVHMGHPQRGLSEIEEALQWAEEVDHRVLIHTVHMYLARCQYEAGRYELALGTAVKAAEMAARVGDRWVEAVCLRTQAEIEMRLPKPDWPAMETHLIHARDALRQIRARPDLARTYLTMRRLYDRAGQVAWAVDCHFRAVTIFEELGMDAERRTAQGQAAGERTGAVVIPGLELRGPNVVLSVDQSYL